MKSPKPSTGKKTKLKRNELKTNKDPRGGGGVKSETKTSRGPSLAHEGTKHNEMFLAEVVKSPKSSNGKKTNLKLSDLKTNNDPRAGGGVKSETKPSHGPSPDYNGQNHNETFLAEVMKSPKPSNGKKTN